MPTYSDAVKKHSKRPRKARHVDARKTSRNTVGQADKKGIKRWMKRPGKVDIAGLDTKGHGKPPMSLVPSSVRKKKVKKRTSKRQ